MTSQRGSSALRFSGGPVERIIKSPDFKMPKITIHCVRHAQGYHNLCEANHKLPDPSLTPLGEQQCLALRDSFPYHDRITHLVASPMRRTIYTCALGFNAEATGRGLPIVTLPELQETSDLPADTGSDPAKLRAEFEAGLMKGKVDLGLVHEGWNNKGPDSKFEPTAEKIEGRAREARMWLRNLGMRFGEDAEIVVVTHGGFLHYFTEDWVGHHKFVGTGWQNTEFRSYTFHSETDESASLVETFESRERRRGEERPLTATEQRELRASAEKEWGDSGYQAPSVQTMA